MAEPPHSPIEWLLGGGGLIALGGGIKWLWDQVTRRADKRHADLDAREDALDDKEAALAAKMEERLRVLEDKVAQQGHELENHRIAIHVLVAKIARDDPKAPELKQVAEILGKAFPVHLHVPPDMVDVLRQID